MLAFMAYAVLIAALLGLAALATERWFTEFGFARRGVWLGALAVSVALPVFAVLVGIEPSATADALVPGVTAPEPAEAGDWVQPATDQAEIDLPIKTDPMDSETALRPADRIRAGLNALPALDEALGIIWIASSAAMLLAFGFAAFALNLTARRWRHVPFEGGELLVSDRVGPAMFGLLRPRIVVPEWLLEASESLRSLAVRHEREHAASRDQWLLAAALILLAAEPWNPMLWWQLRRLRAAIEIDCDARVIRGGADASTYSRMLLAIRQRRPTMLLAAVALTEPVSLLERRIEVLLGTHRPKRRMISIASATLAAGLVATACNVNPPAMNDTDEAIPLLEAGARPGTDIRIGDERVLILVDVSLSMVDRTAAGIERAQTMTDAERRRTAKWGQLADVVGGLAARIPPGASFQMIAFNDEARSLVPGSNGEWLPATDRRAMGRALRTLRTETTPAGPKDLNAAMTAAAALDPPPESIYLVTDGLPTAATEAEQIRRLLDASEAIPPGARTSVILMPEDQSQPAAAAYWTLALSTGGMLLAPAADAQGYELIFRVPEASEYLMLIVDTSGSMRRYEWDRLHVLIDDTLASYSALVGLQVLSDQGIPLLPGTDGDWLPDTPSNRQRILEALGDWDAFSTSNPRRGILTAIDEYYAPGRSVSLHVFSDDFSSGGDAIENLVAEVDAANRMTADGSERVRINTVAFPVYYDAIGAMGTGGDYANLAREIAQRNGGVFVGLPARRSAADNANATQGAGAR